MRSIDRKFYDSKAWNQVRKNVWLKQYCLCANCNRPVYVRGLTDYIPKENRVKGIVHHKEHLNNDNVYDDNITLNEDNLIGLCVTCHNELHFTTEALRDGYKFDENGNLISSK